MPGEQPSSGALAGVRRVHLVGIGGSGMSSLADLLLARGLEVSGSDLSTTSAARLRERGAAVAIGHRSEQVDGAELVVRSAAIEVDNPEVAEARRRGIPILTHAEALGELMLGQTAVAVAGTHGKTTTTAMIGFILAETGRDPTVLVGATALNFGGGARLGRGGVIVVEADEYDRRFLALHPSVALITGIEPDHLDYFRDLDEIVGAFRAFVDRLPPDGVLVTCADDPVLTALDLPRSRVSYGTAPSSDWRLSRFEPRDGGGCAFEAVGPGGPVRAQLQLSGIHNALNALGALATTAALGAPCRQAAEALATFKGTERRFQTLARARGVWVLDDYAHHPTAVRATLQAARQVHRGRLWAVFQPHTTNRTAALLDELAVAFEPADLLTLLPIYRPAGREKAERPVSSADLAGLIRRPPVRVAASLEEAEAALMSEARPDDLVLVMGAGNVTELAHALAARLKSEDCA